MKYFQLALFCFICVANSYGQTVTNSYGRIDVEITKEKKPKRVYTKVEIKPAFPGGDSSWVQSLENKLNQSVRANRRVKKGKYIVSVQFVVDRNGSISDVKALTSNGYGMEAEVLRAIKKKAKWLPSSQGVPVKPYRTSSSTPPVSN